MPLSVHPGVAVEEGRDFATSLLLQPLPTIRGGQLAKHDLVDARILIEILAHFKPTVFAVEVVGVVVRLETLQPQFVVALKELRLDVPQQPSAESLAVGRMVDHHQVNQIASTDRVADDLCVLQDDPALTETLLDEAVGRAAVEEGIDGLIPEETAVACANRPSGEGNQWADIGWKGLANDDVHRLKRIVMGH